MECILCKYTHIIHEDNSLPLSCNYIIETTGHYILHTVLCILQMMSTILFLLTVLLYNSVEDDVFSGFCGVMVYYRNHVVVMIKNNPVDYNYTVKTDVLW